MVCNFCTLSDVKNEGQITNTALDEAIVYKIQSLSEELDEKKIDGATDFNLKKACLYGVLSWLEKKSLIQSTVTVASESEGDVSRSYFVSGKTQSVGTDKSYNEKYLEYLYQVIEIPTLGEIVGVAKYDYW